MKNSKSSGRQEEILLSKEFLNTSRECALTLRPLAPDSGGILKSNPGHPKKSRVERFSRRRIGRQCATAIPFLTLLFSAGCANQPPQQNALSGKRLVVTATFSGFINPNYSYFFLINNAGDFNAPGPVAVFVPPYGNGFATGSRGNSLGGFTDFVRFDSLQPGNAGYTLYHVLGEPSRSQFRNLGSPISATRPSIDGTSLTGKQLQFEIDLSQIITDSNGNPLPSADAATMARNLRYLQVNFVATDRVPIDGTTQVSKFVDTLGDTQTPEGRSSFLIIDLTQTTPYKNGGNTLSSVDEPTSNDVFPPGGDPALDLVDWSITVKQQ